MSQEAPPQEQSTEPEPERVLEAPVESHTVRTVPYERFQEVNRAAKAAKDELSQLKGRLDELDNRDQSELQRERKKREQFEREAGELSQRLTQTERQGWLREAARDLKFDDPDDATAFINVANVEDPDDAVSAVKDLAKRKPKLLRSESPPAEIGQVVRNGQQVRRENGQPQQGQSAALDPQAAEFLNQLNDAKTASGWQSLPLA